MQYIYTVKTKKLSCFVPEDILKEAVALTELNQTDTLIEGLKELIRANKRKSILNLKGKLKIKFDIEKDRQRARF